MSTSTSFKYLVIFFTLFSVVNISAATDVSTSRANINSPGDTLIIEGLQMPHRASTVLLESPDTLGLEADDQILLETDTASLVMEGEARQEGSAPLLDARVDYSANDSIFFDTNKQKVFLYGTVEIKYKEINLKAGYVEIDFKTKILYARGIFDENGVERQRPNFNDGKQSFVSKEMWYNFETKRGRTKNVFTAENDGYLHGDIVKIDSEECIYVKGGKFTTCDCPEPHFHIAFSKAKVIPDDKIITSMAYFVIQGVPTPLIIPFGFFPNTKKQSSGILFPTFGEDANRGFYLQGLGFYTPLNDYFDLSIRTDLYSRGSWAATIGSNYRKLYNYSGNFNLTYAINVTGSKGLPDYSRQRDFRITWSHNQDPKARPNSTFRASVNAGSSKTTRFNPNSDDDYLNNTLSSSVSYQRNWANGKYNFSANLRHNQNTNTGRVNLTLPEISFSVARFNPFKRKTRSGSEKWYESISINYTMNARNEIQTVDSLLFTKETLDKMRYGVSHHLPVNHSFRLFKHWNLSNNLDYRQNWYFYSIDKRWDPDANDGVGIVVTDTIRGFRTSHDLRYSASLSTRVYGLVRFGKGPVSAIRHVVTPSFSFSFRPDYSSPFWGYNRSVYNEITQRYEDYSIFSGQIYQAPAMGRSGSLNFTIGNNLEIKLRGRKDSIQAPDKKISIIDNLTISGGYDFMRDSLKWNDIRVSGRTRLFNQFDIVFSGSWSLYDVDETGRSINRFVWDTKKKPLLLRNSNWSTGFNYTFRSKVRPGASGAGMGMQQMPDRPGGSGGPPGPDGWNLLGGNGEDEGGEPVHPVSAKVDFSVPWSLSINYTFRYDTRYVPQEDRFERKVIQTLGFNGEVNLTRNWRVGFRSGWDFEAMDLTYTSFNIYRDLHCWEMIFNWIPFGFRKSYNFTIRVKNPLLKDLKYEKGTHHLGSGFPSF